MQIDIKQAKLHPDKLFKKPQDVILTTLSKKDKADILIAWQNQIERESESTAEGMPGSTTHLEQLELITSLLETL